jgi:hypothetical protein
MASHLDRSVTLEWNERAILNLVARRILYNADIVEFLHVNKEEVLLSIYQPSDAVRALFPVLSERGSTIDFIQSVINNTADGTGHTTPREVVQLLNAMKDAQLEHLYRGGSDPPENYLIGDVAFGEGARKVAALRLNQTIYAEYPEWMPHIKMLEDRKTGREYFVTQLKRIWQVDEATALQTATELVRIGFFDYQISKSGLGIYKIPRIYQLALNLV